MFGSHPTEAELIEQVRPLDRFHSLWLLARINLLLALDRFNEHMNERRTAKLQTYLVNLLVDEELFENLKRKFGPERLEDRQPFHFLQVLTLMKKIAIEGAKEGGLRPDADREAAYRLGRCLIMANDFLFAPEYLRAIRRGRPSIKKKRIALQLQVGAGLEVANPPAINTSIVRSDVIFGDILQKVPCSLDIRGVFKERSGMSLEDYVDHVLGLLTYYITLDFEKVINEPGLACINADGVFAEASRELVKKFWDMELTSIDELDSSFKEPSELKPYHDFIALRKKPFLEVESRNAIPIHVGFVQEKLESGLFWAIFNSLKTDKERYDLFTNWGHLFEEYVSQLLSRSCAGSGETYHAFPKFSDNGDEAFDGIVASGGRWVVMEYKGGFLNAVAKYAENEGAFLRDVERKFGAGKGAGIEQLVRKIAALFPANPKDRRSLVGADSSKVSVVVPVMIVQEAFISSEITALNLVEVFGTLKRKQHLDAKVVCTFPLILDVSEVEALKPYVQQKKVALVDCLMERIRKGAGGILSFRDFFPEYLRQRGVVDGVRDDETMALFHKIMDRISVRFFKKSIDAA